ncbi:MAG: hypothetical protein WB502_11965 [Thermoactinomyces sp.]
MEYKDEQDRKISFNFTLGDAIVVSYFTLLLYVISFFIDTTYKSYFNIPLYYSEFTLEYYIGGSIMIPMFMIAIIATIWSGSIKDGLLKSMSQPRLFEDNDRKNKIKMLEEIITTAWRYLILYSIASMFKLVGEDQYIIYVFFVFLLEFIILPGCLAVVHFFYRIFIKLNCIIKRKSFFNSYQLPPKSWKLRWRQYKEWYIQYLRALRDPLEFYRYFPATVRMLLMIVLLSLIMFFFAYKYGFYAAQQKTHFYTVKQTNEEKWVVLGTYDDSLIIAPLRKKQIEARFRLLDRKSQVASSAKYEKVGPLKVKGKKEDEKLFYHYLRY